MTIGHNEFDGSDRRRPAWMPHPGLLAFVLALWVLAVAAQAPAWLKP